METIYHFTKISTLVELILPTMLLKLNSIENMNDPRETKIFGFSQITDSVDNSSLEKNNKEFSDFIKKNIKICSFVKNATVGDSIIEGFKNTMMWAHYGDNHKGVSIALNYNKIKEKNKKIKFEKIEYFKPNNNFLQIDKQEYNKDKKKYRENLFINEETLKKLFFQKTWEWSNENEIRALIKNGKKKDDFIKIKDCIEMIYLGVDCSENYIPSIQKYISPEKIKKLKFEYDRIRIKQ
ncbi:MAG TPA: DUF2971 domain-containing protein [Bacteroidales bacterium]|jgi:hypothetical protein|nr:DUF2971 domain-containing protein [Bacteroidales bacterium]